MFTLYSVNKYYRFYARNWLCVNEYKHKKMIKKKKKPRFFCFIFTRRLITFVTKLHCYRSRSLKNNITLVLSERGLISNTVSLAPKCLQLRLVVSRVSEMFVFLYSFFFFTTFKYSKLNSINVRHD